MERQKRLAAVAKKKQAIETAREKEHEKKEETPNN